MAEHEHGHDHDDEHDEGAPKMGGRVPSVKHVWCSVDGEHHVIGHIVRSAYQNEAGETKSDVFADGGVHAMAFRDPSDFDEHGSGLCFWNVVTDVEGSNQG